MATTNEAMQLDTKLNQLLSNLSNNNEKSSLTEKLSKLIAITKTVSELAPQFDFSPEVKGSGLRTYLFRLEKFIEKCLSDLFENNNLKSNVSSDDYELVMDMMVTNGELIESSARTSLGQTDNVLSRQEIAEKFLSINVEQYQALMKFGPFWLDEDKTKTIKKIGIMSAIVQGGWGLAFSSKKRLNHLATNALDTTIAAFRSSFSMFGTKWMEKIITWSLPIDMHKEVNIRCCSNKEIQEDGSIIDKVLVNMVTCHIWRHGSSEEFNDTVIFYSHGSGFTVGNPRIYSKQMRLLCNYLPGATVIAPDYRKAPENKYPKGLQDVFDCFLSLLGTIESDLQKEAGLNGKPRKIIISGDSAGGTFSLALLRILDALAIKLDDIGINVLLLNPCGSPIYEPTNLPSRTLQIIDPSLSIAGMQLFFDAYCPGGSNDPDLKPSWYRQEDMSKIVKRIEEITDHCNKDPFFDPVQDNFEKFPGRLVVICGREDPLVDDSIMISRRWAKDRVELILLDMALHGFYGLDSQKSNSKQLSGSLPIILENYRKLLIE